MTDYTAEDTATRNRPAAALYGALYTMAAASKESPEYQSCLVFMPRVTLSPVLTHPATPTIDFWEGQGTITDANYATDISSATVTVGLCFARLSEPEHRPTGDFAISNFLQSIYNLPFKSDAITFSQEVRLKSLGKDIPISDEARDLANRHQVSDFLQTTLALAERNFSGLDGIEITAECDPETEEEWITVSVRVMGDTKDVLDMYDAYTRQFVKSVPWPVRDKIRLVYDLV